MMYVSMKFSHTRGNKLQSSSVESWCRMRPLLLLSVLGLLTVQTVAADAFYGDRAAFVIPSSTRSFLYSSIRGGTSTVDQREEEAVLADLDDEEEEGDEEEEEEVEVFVSEEESEQDKEKEDFKLDASLAAAALKSATKTKEKTEKKERAEVKTAVNTKLAKPKRKSLIKMIPYILRASLNPITLLSMTKAYWASLFNLDYLKQKDDSSQELRSALERKAMRSPPKRGHRKMKRGQAKTLSDLPQLSS